MIAAVGEATAQPFFITRLRDRMLASPTGRRILRDRPRITSRTLPLATLRQAIPNLDPKQIVAVYCKGGYRSMIASSLLQRAGFKHVINMTGGFDAWQQAKLPTVTGKPVGV